MSGTAVLLAGGWELLVFPHPEGMADHRHAGPLAHGGLVWARRMPRAMMELCGQHCWGSALRWRLWGAGPEGSKMAVSHYVTTGGGRPAPQHEDQVVGGQWLPFPGEDWLICKMAAREQERLLLTLWRVAAGGDEKGHKPSILLRLNHSRDSREQPHHLHFLGDGHGVGGAAMRRRGGGKVPARAARGRRRAAGPAQRAPWPWAGGARPSAGPTLPRGLSSSPAPFIYMLFIYLFRPRKEFEVRGGRRRGGAVRGGGVGDWKRERERKRGGRPPYGPGTFPAGGRRGEPSRCPRARRVAAGEEEEERGGRRPRRRRGGDAALGAVRPSCCWLRQPRRLPLCLSSPLILRTASPEACHSAKHSLLNRESERERWRERGRRRGEEPSPATQHGFGGPLRGSGGRGAGGRRSGRRGGQRREPLPEPS